MKPLFTSETVFSFDGYRSLSLAVERQKKFYWSVLFIFEFITIIMTIYYLVSVGNSSMGYAFLCISVLFPIAMYIRISAGIRSHYRKMSQYEGKMFRYAFYENYCDVTAEKTHVTLQYSKLARIILDRHHIFLMENNSKGYIIDASSCSDDLIMFLSRKANEYNRHGSILNSHTL